MTRQEAFDKAKTLSLTGNVHVDESQASYDGGSGEYLYFAINIDGVAVNCHDSYEDCFADLIPKLQEGRIKRAAQLRKELEAAEEAIKKAL